MTNKHLSTSICLVFLLSIFTLPVVAQYDFTIADSIAKNIVSEEVPLPDLAQQLTQNLNTDAEKARAIYMWIAGNVRYDCKKFHNRKTPRFTARSEAELADKMMAYRQKTLTRSFERKKGVCEDYSRMFNAFCKEVGLESVQVVGNARDFHKPYRKSLGESHAWNAVKIDGQWFLVDATWGAGYTDANVTRFKRRLTPGYFMVAPELLVQTHFPEDTKWQLLDKPLNQKAFANQPMVNIGDRKHQIEDASSQIETTKSGKRIVRFKFKNTPKYLVVTNRKSKPIDFKKRIENGYTILEFSKTSAKKIVIWGGNSRKKLNWMAMYKA